jgi:hypothetical protein
MKAIEAFATSDGEVTKVFYAELLRRGPIGDLAVNLFRSQKKSTRAKAYRGKFRGMGYEQKQWSMGNICTLLLAHGQEWGITFGWKPDPNVFFDMKASQVLYVDLPQGQVSFHSPSRGLGPDYPRDWDRTNKSAERVLAFCDSVMSRPVVEGVSA